MKLIIRYFGVVLALIFFVAQANAQRKIKIENSDALEGGKRGDESYTRFIGNVVFSQKDTWIYCDTAIVFKKTNTVRAFGNVKITDQDSVTITSRQLIYNGDTRVAQLRGNVVFTKLGVMTLYTNFLDYDRNAQLATYFNNGKLEDSTNVLTSKKGYYDVNIDMASFKGDVVGTNEDYVLHSDTLQYNSVSKIIYFRDSTHLQDRDGNVFIYESGTYDTENKESVLQSNFVETESYILKARMLRIDEKLDYYNASAAVELYDKENDILVTGNKGEHWERTQITKIYDHAVLRLIDDEDTLYLTADTLVSIDSEVESKKRLLAYHNVKVYKHDLQGKTDSLAYHIDSSVIYFYGNPILWNGENQITADSINAEMVDNRLKRLNLSKNAFVISQDTLKLFNQIKGRKMTAYFENNKISRVNVEGNGESIFNALNDEETDLMGLNKTNSSALSILFEDNKAKTLVLLAEADASFIPPHEITAEKRNLKGFRWRINEKPGKEEVLSGTAPGSSDQVSKSKVQ